jgi:polar amino acid transport system substrate-binding protein
MNRRGLFAAAIGAALALGVAGSAYAQDTLAKVKAAGVMKVGTETEFAPFDFIDAGKHVGLNVDLFDEIGKELGVKIEWVTLPWDGVLPGLEAKKFDIVAGPATITKARMEHYVFSAPIAEATVAIMKRAGDKSINKPEDIAGKTIGGAKATAQLAQLKAFGEKLKGGVTIKEYVGFNEAYADLAAGRIVAVGNSLPNIAFVAKQRPDTFAVVLPTFGVKTYFGYIGRKGDDDKSLMAAVDAALVKMKKDGRMAALQKKWFGVSFDTPDAVTSPNI